MSFLENITLVLVAGFITALATGIGALPFFFFRSISDRRNVVLWGLSLGIMVSAFVFGLVDEGLTEGTPLELVAGLATGVLLVVVVRDILLDANLDPREYEEARISRNLYSSSGF